MSRVMAAEDVLTVGLVKLVVCVKPQGILLLLSMYMYYVN